jgi:hypothetical protein
MKRKLITTADSHEEYLSKDGYESASTIKLAVQSDQDYLWFKKARPSTKSQAFGTALHMNLLEPDRFDKYYWCLRNEDKVDRDATWVVKANKDKKVELIAQNQGKECLEQEDWDAIQIVSERVIFDDRFTKFVAQSTKEQSFYVEDFFAGISTKCRPDSYMPTIEVDIKTTKAADPKGFWYEFIKYKYHIQRALAVDMMRLFGIDIEQSCILAVSNEAPYNHEFYRVPQHLLDTGRELCQEGLRRIARIRDGQIYTGFIAPEHEVDQNGMIVLENKWK